MSQLSENIFDERGGLRADLENVTVPPERRPVFEALVNAVRAAELAEADVIAKADAEASRQSSNQRRSRNAEMDSPR